MVTAWRAAENGPAIAITTEGTAPDLAKANELAATIRQSKPNTQWCFLAPFSRSFTVHPAMGKGGHISPLAAYDAKADRFRILDVARYKYPPVWVKASDLFDAMNTTDAANGNRTRGYVLVAKAGAAQ
jgi:hypothetical protein